MNKSFGLGLWPLSLGAFCLLQACSDAGTKKEDPEPDAAMMPDVQRGPGTYPAGAFSVDIDDKGGFVVTHEAAPDRPLLSNPKGASGIAAFSVSDKITEQGGSFTLTETVKSTCDVLTELAIEAVDKGVQLKATLSCDGKTAPVSLTFAEASPSSLDFTLKLEGEKPAFNQVALVHAADEDERVVGFGEQFTITDLRGRKFPVIVEEGGIGRTEALAASLGSAAGSFYSTYAPMPFMFTDRGRSLLLDNKEMSWFDLTAKDRLVTRLRGTEMRGHVLFGDKPRDIVEALTVYTGRMPALPAWINEGAVVGMQGGTERVREVLAQLEAKGTKIGGFWLQDWVGKRQTGIGSRLWWNWQLNTTQYPGWDELVSDLHAKDIRVMTYANPYLVDVDGDPNFTRNLYREARDARFLVKDSMGMPYVHISGTFEAGIVDLTNPKAVDWFKEVLRKEVLGVGADGYMADFGEAIAFDAVLGSKDPASLVHNEYPELWANLNRELFKDEGILGDAVFFMRSAYTTSPGAATLFWAGDQRVSWDADDGLASAVRGIVTGGLSGISLNHSDIGGYTALLDMRSKELLLRWMEMSAFTATYRTHEGSRPEASAQIYDDDENLTAFARFADVFASLASYREELMKEATQKGLPLVRHLLLEYPDDPRAWSEDATFMLGPDVLVAPVVTPGALKVKAYVPGGEWVHLWSGDEYGKAAEVEVDAPLGQPGVFYRKGSKAGQALEAVK